MTLTKRTFFLALLPVLFLSLAFPAHGAGEVDPSFNASLIRAPWGRAFRSYVQTDGKIITHGRFLATNGVPSGDVVRLNADGSTDTSFSGPSVGDGTIRQIGQQSDGKIIIAGVFILFDGGGNVFRGIARLNTNGTLDTTFVGDPTIPSILWDLVDMVVLPDDKILVGGGNGSARLLSNGTVDPSFSAVNRFLGVVTFAVQPDGKIVNSNGSNLRRYNADGTTDASFQVASFSSQVYDVDIMPSGKIIVGGHFTHVNSFLLPKLARFNADGTVDAAFTNIFGSEVGSHLYEVVPLPNDQILLILNNVLRLNADGTLDGSFVSGLPTGGWDLDLQSDGKIILSSGPAFQSDPANQDLVARLQPDGAVDNTFKANFGWFGMGEKIFVQQDGKILVGGSFNFANNFERPGLARFNPDGTADPGFDPDIPSGVSAIDVQPDGKIVVNVPSQTPVDARRLNPDGSLDVVFPGSGRATDVRVLSNGKILICGINYIKRFNSNGTPDASFATTVNNSVAKMTVQPDGKILIVGDFTQVNLAARGRVARLNSDGSLDATFDTSTGASLTVNDVALQSDGKVVIVGRFLGVNFVTRARIARLNLDGSLDTGFAPAASSDVYTVRVQPNNKIVIGGLFQSLNNVSRPRIGRFHPDGTLDTSFAPVLSHWHPVDTEVINDTGVQSDNKILLAGSFTKVNGIPKLGIVRLLEPPSTKLFDYDGDGKADVSVFRPSESRWYILRSSDSVVYQPVFAIPGDVPVPADYDGDGKTDVAIFRPSAGDWWYLASGDSSQRSTHWGASGDVPRPSDFDGDGRSDFIVFRPSENNWYRLGSGGTFSVINFGLAGDKPVTGDFDGDGKSDPAIYRLSTGDWWWQSSVDNGQRATHFGNSTDTPAAADFDGDGKTDFAVYRASTGTWYILNSGNGQATIVNFGIAEDKPVAADYDGDSRADIAVFRPSTGVWYLLRSTSGFAGVQFGISTDVPTPSAFVP